MAYTQTERNEVKQTLLQQTNQFIHLTWRSSRATFLNIVKVIVDELQIISEATWLSKHLNCMSFT